MSVADPLDVCLLRWRNNLIDLTRRNPLLALRPERSRFLELTAPDVKTLFAALALQNKPLRLWLPTAEVTPGENKKSAAPTTLDIVCSDHEGMPHEERGPLVAVLTNLYRRAQADFRERGLHILHLGLGLLEWRDDDDEPMRSPLILLPVSLNRPSLREPFTLTPTDEDPFVNPALTVRLQQDFDFRLPAEPENWEEKLVEAYLDEVQTAIAGLPGWKVERRAFLSLFSFFKGVMHQDLEEHAEQVKAHPLVRALAGVAPPPKPAPLPSEQELDDQPDRQGPQLILDADASQRLCLEAAARGDHFVLIGPPGTGKSQTIANLIADHIARGKKVLFVSEKMAALEVVYQRLRHVGLGDFCLELHSHKANKREVVNELARCLQAPQLSSPTTSEDELARLQTRRAQLNRYLRALHQRREPMGHSAWDALAELPRWQAVPALPLGMPLVRETGDTARQLVVTEITQGQLDDLQQLLQKSQQFWHIRPGANFPWWGFKADKYNLQLRDEVVGLIDKTRGRLDKLKSAAEHYAKQLQVTGPTAWLLRLGELLESKPGAIPSTWFTLTDWPALQADLDRSAEQYQRLGQARTPLTARYGPALWSLPEESASRLEQAWKNAAPWLAPGDTSGALLLKHQQALRGWAADTLKRLPTWLAEIRTVEKWLTIPLPRGAGSTGQGKTMPVGEGALDPAPQAVKHLVKLAHLCLSDHAPERAWVQNSQDLAGAQAEIAAAKTIFTTYRERRTLLLQTYKESFFELELERMAKAFEGPYSSWFRFLNGGYRRDRRTIRRRTRNEEVPATVADDVLMGREVVLAKRKIEEEAPRRAAALGRYEKGVETDLDEAEKATRIANEALHLVREFGGDGMPPRLIDALCATSPPQEKIRAAVKRLSESYNAWAHATQELQALLPMDRLPGVGAPLDECALSALQQYARDLQTALNALASATDPVLAKAPAPPIDLASILTDLRQAEELRHFEAAQATEDQRCRERFGPDVKGLHTNWDALRKSLAWAKRVRDHWTKHPAPSTPLLPTHLVAHLEAKTLPPVRDLRTNQDLYEQALQVFEHRFEAPGPLLDGKQLHEHPVEAVYPHLQKLRDRVGELADWVDWRHLPDRFNHLGLRPFWDSLQQATVPREQVVGVFLKAFWTSWIEAIFQEDPTLSQFRRQDHERTLEEFRELDRQFIADGATRVIQRAAMPPADPGAEGQLLLREAHKKSKHWPLRRLFDAMPALLLRLKPCLLMSPLSVSQFLPADPAKVHFDLVVFDEASQILPEDAIGAVSRGQQVVITGDNQQLPPTTFFQQQAAEEDDQAEEETPLFESILDACLAAGVPQRMLRWHYRSRHEHLIAFSNERFYDGRLLTFPSALAAHPELGVRFHHVPDAAYDRGGRRDNPREADVVADLVVKQVREHPQLSVGVIAFSYPQMEALQDAIDRRLEQHPELEQFFQGDRLEGFFVKNLETVQGDERDVIFLSVGYGRDAQSKLILNFGPVNRAGGARRLNVAVTRARRQLIVVSSLRAQDIPQEAESLAHLRHYLDFAERGVVALQGGEETEAAPVPVHALQADVMNEVQRLGFQAVPQVGCGPYRIDLGIVDPKKAGAFLLGIEFDGPAYHQVGTARDRDRLRPELLAKLGWRLHRIWAPDWLHRQAEEVERLKKALKPE